MPDSQNRWANGGFNAIDMRPEASQQLKNFFANSDLQSLSSSKFAKQIRPEPTGQAAIKQSEAEEDWQSADAWRWQ